MGTAADEVKYPMFVGRLDGRILDVDECGTHNDGDDDEDINKSDVSLLVLPHNTTTGMSLVRLAANHPQILMSKN